VDDDVRQSLARVTGSGFMFDVATGLLREVSPR